MLYFLQLKLYTFLFTYLAICVKSLEHKFCLNFSKVHGLVACGGEDGAVECFDMRVRSSVGRIDAVGPSGDVDQVVNLLSVAFSRHRNTVRMYQEIFILHVLKLS